jgi:hypothetical protein
MDRLWIIEAIETHQYDDEDGMDCQFVGTITAVPALPLAHTLLVVVAGPGYPLFVAAAKTVEIRHLKGDVAGTTDVFGAL